ncbi:hypothetical protein AM593_04433, partial [Mytilus galloprovincialis]
MPSCPQCGDTVTKEQKFCSNCAWKVDSTIFDQEGIICTGQKDDGTACGRQLIKNAKFCPDCAKPVQKADADVPVSDASLSAIDNSLTLQNGQNTIGSTDLEVKQHNDSIVQPEQVGEGQTVPNQNVPEGCRIKNIDVANGNSKEIPTPSDSTPSDTEAAVKLVTDQQTPEPNSEGQKENPDSTPESRELITESNSASKEQNRETPTSQEQIPDSDPKPFSHEQTGSKRDEVKMEASSSQVPGSKNKTSHTQNTNDEPETPPKKLKLANESDSFRFQESSTKKGTVTTQPHSVFGPDKNQDKPTVSDETTTEYSPRSDRNQDKTTDLETTADSQAAPGSDRFKDSFIFGALSNLTDPSYLKGESSSQKDDTEVSQGREDGHKDKDKTDKESSTISEKEGKQDEESTDDDSSDSKDSDSEKSDGDNKKLPASHKKKKDGKKNKKIKEEKKKERKKRKENKDGNSNTNSSSTKDTRSSTGNSSPGSKSYGTKEKASVDETAGSSNKGKKQSTGSFVDVCFHAVISPTILINPDKDFVVITFEKYAGGWESKQHKLKLERYVSYIPNPSSFYIYNI